MVIKDRGNIKWTSLMLPEHVKLLRDWANEDESIRKPMLDEQELDQMNSLIQTAMTSGQRLVFTYYEEQGCKLLVGTPRSYQESAQRLKVTDEFQNSHWLPISAIVDARAAE